VPKGKFKSPAPGTLPKRGAELLEEVYVSCRERNPSENPKDKQKCAASAWFVVGKTYKKNKKTGKWKRR
jgi:hypothetical protein